MGLSTLIVAILVLVLLYFVIGLIPDALLKRIGYALLIISAILWVIRNLDALMALRV